jgi:uncharacterized cupin superfamily protein
MFEETAPPGTQTNFHLHHASDEIAYVLSGEITFKIGDQITVGGPGTCASCHAASHMEEHGSRSRTSALPVHACDGGQIRRRVETAGSDCVDMFLRHLEIASNADVIRFAPPFPTRTPSRAIGSAGSVDAAAPRSLCGRSGHWNGKETPCGRLELECVTVGAIALTCTHRSQHGYHHVTHYSSRHYGTGRWRLVRPWTLVLRKTGGRRRSTP